MDFDEKEVDVDESVEDSGEFEILFEEPEMNSDDYEKECNRIIEENEKYLDLFESALTEKGMSKRTIYKHIGNVDFYINTFLLNYDPTPMVNGCYMIDSFLGEFFIRKCMWSTPDSIKTTATSIKRFYSCMADNGIIKKGDYEVLCEIIKESIKDWQETCRQFNDPTEENPFALF